MKYGQTRQLILPSLIARLIRRHGYCPIQLHPRLSFRGSDALHRHYRQPLSLPLIFSETISIAQ